MITYENALERAIAYLKDSEIPLQLTHEGEFSEGWFFCYQSKEYIETGSLSAQLAGNGPFLIDKETGELHVLGTAKPLKEYLNQYAMKNQKDKDINGTDLLVESNLEQLIKSVPFSA